MQDVWQGRGGACLLALAGLAACKSEPPKPTEEPAPPAAATASALLLAARTVPAGVVEGGPWVPEFALRYDVGGAGLDYPGALARCSERSLSLCTEPEWTRACALDPKVGELETWTASADADGFVVRGGGAGCGARSTAPASATAPSRVGVCCSRAVAIAGAARDPAFLLRTSSKLLAFESAVHKSDGRAVRALLGDPMKLYGVEKSREAAASLLLTMQQKHPDSWAIHDTCDVAIEPDGTWRADCRKIAGQGGKLAVVVTRYVWAGGDATIQSIADPKIIRGFTPP